MCFNPLNPKIKICILIKFVASIDFLQKKWGEVDKISIKFILCDHVLFYEALILQGEIW